MTYLASERKHIREAEREARREQRERREIISGLMSTPAGRSWMLARLEACHVFLSSYHEKALVMAFAEGQRSIGLQFINDIMAACPDRYVEMMREGNARDLARSNNRSRANGDGADPGTSAGDDSLDGADAESGDGEAVDTE